MLTLFLIGEWWLRVINKINAQVSLEHAGPLTQDTREPGTDSGSA